MKKILILISVILPGLVGGQNAFENYIENYKDIAIEEMQRTGIPASIKLAQALLESNAGRSELSRKGNNHFGIKCGGSWKGKTVMRKDDDYRNGKLVKSCFRSYDHPEESFIAHSEFLRDPNKNHRYGFLFRLDADDYRSWARGLKRAGYATNPRYPQLLIGLIEKYELHKYDRAGSTQPPEIVMEEGYVPEVKIVNDVEYVYAREGETPMQIAMDFERSVERIIKYNEGIEDQGQKLAAGQRVFLQRKRSSYRGKRKFHYVKEGETLFEIAQQYGMRLEKLRKKNKLDKGEQPAVGEQVRLRGLNWFDKKPEVRSEQESILPERPDETLPPDEEVESLPTAEKNESEQEENSTDPPVSQSDSTNLQSGDQKDPSSEAIARTDTIYTVQKGDTLYSISRQFDVKVELLRERNGLDSNALTIGQELIIGE